MGKYIELNSSQKEEIRRLTQLANRRIKATEKVYRKAGIDTLPKEVVGDFQIKEKWNTKSTPLSRSVKFESQSEYRKQLNMLRSFERSRPSITEYTAVQREKVAQAVVTSLGDELSFDNVHKKLSKMSAPEIAQFWNTFSDKSAKKGLQYSSTAVMADTFAELFPEDLVSTIPKKKKRRR